LAISTITGAGAGAGDGITIFFNASRGISSGSGSAAASGDATEQGETPESATPRLFFFNNEASKTSVVKDMVPFSGKALASTSMLLLTIPKFLLLLLLLLLLFFFFFFLFQNVKKVGGVMRGSRRKEEDEEGERMLANELINACEEEGAKHVRDDTVQVMCQSEEIGKIKKIRSD
jgi:hypothetical protein